MKPFDEASFRAQFDAHGSIIPSRSAVERIETEFPDRSDADKWRLAQAQTHWSNEHDQILTASNGCELAEPP